MAINLKFKGSNNAKALETFNGRTLYRSYAYSDNLDVAAVDPTYDAFLGVAIPYTKDFWFVENLFYGRVDPSYNVVEPNRNQLKTIGGELSKRVVVFNFVADAFRAFHSEYSKRAALGNLRGENPTFSNLVPKAGYINPDAMYKKYVSNIYYEFAQSYLDQNGYFAINSFEDFVREFLNYLQVRSKVANNPITKSAFLVGSRMSPMSTGLCIEIDTQDHGEDNLKVNNFINDPDFEFYSQLATKYGFLVDKNAPWRMVANVNSPEMLSFSAHYSAAAGNLDGMFSKFYRKVFLNELEDLRTQFLQTYNTFADAHPSTKKALFKEGSIIEETRTRSPLTRGEFDLLYPVEYWLDTYIVIKNLETGCGYTDKELARIIKTARDLFKFDNIRSMSYINRKFKGFSHLSGSMFYEIYKRNLAESNRVDADIMEEIGHASRKAKTVLY